VLTRARGQLPGSGQPKLSDAVRQGAARGARVTLPALISFISARGR
jgi:hypothetical protein